MQNFATLEKIILKKVSQAYVAWMEEDEASTKARLFQACMIAQQNNIYTLEDDVQSLWGDFLYGFNDFAK